MTKTTCRYLGNVLWCMQRCSAIGYLLEVETLGPKLTSVSAILQSECSNRRTPSTAREFLVAHTLTKA